MKSPKRQSRALEKATRSFKVAKYNFQNYLAQKQLKSVKNDQGSYEFVTLLNNQKVNPKPDTLIRIELAYQRALATLRNTRSEMREHSSRQSMGSDSLDLSIEESDDEFTSLSRAPQGAGGH